MKKIIASLAVFAAMTGVAAAESTAPIHEPFSVISADFMANKKIEEANVYNGFGCKGENLSPSLSWQNAPEKTKSFAVTMYDPDAPTGSGWWHWVVYNIPADASGLVEGASGKEGKLPKGAVEGRTDYGSYGYGGPCPPVGHGNHNYIVTVYALDVEKLDLPKDATAALVGFNLNAHAIAKADLTAVYGR